MDDKHNSASFLDMLELMKNYLGAAGQRNLEERLKALMGPPMRGDRPCSETQD